MKKLIAILTCILLVCFSLSSCAAPQTEAPASQETETTGEDTQQDAGDSDENVTIRFVSYGASKAELFGRIVDDFNSSQDKITVDFTTNTQNYFAQLKTQLSTGEAPDICTHLIGARMTPYVESGHLYDLTNEPYMELLQPSALESSTIDGKNYAVPLDAQTFGMFYNVDIFEENNIEVPTTYTEFEQVAQQLQDLGITPFSVNYREAWSVGQFATIVFSPLALPQYYENEDTFYEGNYTFDTPEFRQLLTAYDLIIANAQDRAVDTDLSGQYALFAEGSAAMMPAGNWAIPQIRKLAPDMNVGMFPIPVSENAEENKYAVDYALCLNVTAQTQHPEAVSEFISYFLNSTGETSFYYEAIGVPTGLKETTDKIDPISESLVNSLGEENTVRWFQTVLPEGFDSEVWSFMQEYATSGSTDHDAIIADINSAFEQITSG